MLDQTAGSFRRKYVAQHSYDFDPAEFEKYCPKKTVHLGKKSISTLCNHIQKVCCLDDENAFILLLRFGFGVGYSVMCQFMGTDKQIQGICEAFRFGCKRYLGLTESISDKSMLQAFHLAMQNYEILFMHKSRGICWMQQTSIALDDGTTSLRQALFYARCKSFMQLDKNPPPLANASKLDHNRTKKLARLIQDLPVEFGSIFLLRYFHQWELRKIEAHCNVKYVRGKIEYFRRLFAQRFGLDRPISDKSLMEACSLIVQEMYLV